MTDNVEGQRLQLANPDGSKTFAAIYRHGTRLYIIEGTVPKGAPAPGLFQQSMMFLDEEGKPIRYRSLYTTGYSDAWKFPAPPPPRARAAATPQPIVRPHDPGHLVECLFGNTAGRSVVAAGQSRSITGQVVGLQPVQAISVETVSYHVRVRE